MNTLRDHEAVIGAWLDDGPQTLPADTRQAITVGIRTVTRRRSGIAWPFVGRGLPMFEPRRLSVALASAAVVVVAAAVAFNFYVNRQGIGKPLSLPTTPDAWSRVLIETPSVTGRVASLAVGPHGLLAVVGGDEPARLVVSTDGRNWTLVPEGRHPNLSNDRMFGMPSVVGTDRGLLMLQLNEVWTSEDGYDWRRLAGETTDPDLRMGGPDAATNGGPGLVAVGGDKAWYSLDGSDWSLATVPALPAEILASPDDERYVALTGVVAAGDKLVAWGKASVPRSNNPDEHLAVPLLWASSDGRTWTDVVDPQMDSIAAVTGGPGGFVAAGAGHDAQRGSFDAAWFSADGDSWDIVGALGEERISSKLMMKAAAVSEAGYVLVGGDGLCDSGPWCPSAEAAIWTSLDGRSFSRVASGDVFRVTDPDNVAQTDGALANQVVALGDGFVVGGAYDGKPAIWISGSEQSGSGTNAGASPVPATPTRTPGRPVDFRGTWEATDLPPDSSHLTMAVIALPDGSFQVTVRDDFASVCDGVSSTMTGVAKRTDYGTILIEQPEYVCDDGSQAQALSGPPLDEQLRNFTFTYDYSRDAFDGGGLEWTRVEVAP